MIVPKRIVSLADIEARAEVRPSVEIAWIATEPEAKPHYTLAQLLSRCGRSDLAPNHDDREWLGAGPIGTEEI